MSGPKLIGHPVEWQCRECGEEFLTPRVVVPRDRRRMKCRGELPPEPPQLPSDPVERRKFQLSEYLESAGVPTIYRALDRRSWEEQVLTRAEPPAVVFPKLGETYRERWPEPLEDWRGEGEHWLVAIRGLYGTGKTGLAMALFQEAIVAGLPKPVWYDTAAWIREVRSGVIRGDGSADQVFERAARSGLLLLDDLGAAQSFDERAAMWWRIQVAQLLRERHMWNRPTILTSNAPDLEKALVAIDPSLPTRLEVPLQIEIQGPDLRRKR